MSIIVNTNQQRRPMNLRDLQYVIAVADTGHFGRAAAACNVSQPTLSGQILKLEAELGVSIFERAGRTVRVTGVGEAIVAHARRAVGATEDIIGAARANRDPLAGTLRLGVIPTLGPYLMPFVLPAVTKQLPSLRLALVEDLTDHLVEMVRDGRLDAAIIASEPEAHGLATQPLFEEPFWVALPPGHRLCARKDVKCAELEASSMLLLGDGHCLRDQALELCGHPDLGSLAIADVRAASLETLLNMVAAGYGMTISPGLVLESRVFDRKYLALRRLKGAHASRRVRLIHRPNTPRLPAISALAGLVRKHVPKSMRRLSGKALGPAAKRPAPA
ncbi:MAG: LysR substrate-binding domain-containing protein [Alphaproteobacteria bacterium]